MLYDLAMPVKYIDFEDVLAESLKDPEVAAEWERTQPARDLAVAVARYRGSQNITQTEFGRLLGMKQQQVGRIEEGDVLPTITTMQRICQALGMVITLTIDPTGKVSINFL